MKHTRYKFRAECLQDVVDFINLTIGKIQNLEIYHDPDYPDTRLTFDTSLDKESLLLIIDKIEDGHVMSDTLELLSEYTGKRKYLNR